MNSLNSLWTSLWISPSLNAERGTDKADFFDIPEKNECSLTTCSCCCCRDETVKCLFTILTKQK